MEESCSTGMHTGVVEGEEREKSLEEGARPEGGISRWTRRVQAVSAH